MNTDLSEIEESAGAIIVPIHVNTQTNVDCMSQPNIFRDVLD